MKKTLFPIAILGCLIALTWHLITMRPEPEARKVTRKVPFVEIIEARKTSIRSSIRTHGTIRPRTLTTLIAEVPGIIKEVAPFEDLPSNKANFRAGGFFREGDSLLKIEDLDLRTIEAEARANLRRAQLQLIQERELAKQAKVEWGDRDWRLASDLVKRVPQILKAEAETTAAQARLDQATQDLNRSRVRAPFEGRILRTMADVGQQVGAGASAALAEVYAIDSAEIDLALSPSGLGFLGFSDGFTQDNGPRVAVNVLNAEGKVMHQGWLDRSEGVVDPKTRLTNLVARVNHCLANPFAEPPIQAPLTLGQFVHLRMLGSEVKVFLIPESAFRTQNTLLIVDDENKLRTREVSVVHRANKEVWVRNGLKDGEKVCTTPMEIISEGMDVRVVGDEAEDSNETKP